MRLLSFEKKWQNKAKKWYIESTYGKQLNETKGIFRDEIIKKAKQSVNMINKEKLLKDYFKANPHKKDEYKRQIKRNKEIVTRVGLSVATLALTAGVLTQCQNKKAYTPNIQIENEISKIKSEEKNKKVIEDNEQEDEKQYQDFFEEIENINDDKERDSVITEFTKNKIVEAYNIKHEEKISSAQLEYTNFDQYVLKNKDQFGNDISYERIQKNETVTAGKNQEIEKLNGGFYEFKLKGEVVAVYDSNGQEVIDKKIKHKNEFFKETIPIAKKGADLKKLYRYTHNDNDVKKAENNYKSFVQNFIEKEKEQVKVSKEKDEEKDI